MLGAPEEVRAAMLSKPFRATIAIMLLLAAVAPVVVLWGVLAGASAAVLLVMGGLEGLQTASIIAAAPFLVVMAGLCVSLWHALMDELEDHGVHAE